MKFKIGDKVECTDIDGVGDVLHIGSHYTVNDINNHTSLLRFRETGGEWFSVTRFKLVTKEKESKMNLSLSQEEVLALQCALDQYIDVHQGGMLSDLLADAESYKESNEILGLYTSVIRLSERLKLLKETK